MLDYNYIYRSFVSGDIHPLYAYMYPGLIRYATRLLGETLTSWQRIVCRTQFLRLIWHEKR